MRPNCGSHFVRRSRLHDRSRRSKRGSKLLAPSVLRSVATTIACRRDAQFIVVAPCTGTFFRSAARRRQPPAAVEWQPLRLRRFAISFEGRSYMPRGDNKSAYTDRQKRQAEHIEEGYERRPAQYGKTIVWGTSGARSARMGRGVKSSILMTTEHTGRRRRWKRRNAAWGAVFWTSPPQGCCPNILEKHCVCSRDLV
jgi:hypothetical protein